MEMLKKWELVEFFLNCRKTNKITVTSKRLNGRQEAKAIDPPSRHQEEQKT